MRLPTVRSRAGLPLAVAAFLSATWAGRAQAQFDIGFGYPGVPFLFYSPERVAGPTQYLYDRDRARISEHSNRVQQEAAASQMAAERANSNAYFNRLRDFSGESSYQVGTRRSLASRVSTPRARPQPTPPPSQPQPTPAPSPPTSRQNSVSLDAFFLLGGEFDWPHDAPNLDELPSAKAEAESAVKVVHDELQSQGKAKSQSIGYAKWKLVGYGQQALAKVRSTRTTAVADTFHHFLLSLHGSLDQTDEATVSSPTR